MVDEGERDLGTWSIDDALPSELFRELAQVVGQLEGDRCAKEHTGWWPVDREPLSLVERAARILRERALIDRVPQIVGAEWWIRIAHAWEEHHWHFDKDEDAWERGVMKNPELGTVLYLTAEGGPTLVTNQRAIVEGGDVVALEPSDDEGPKGVEFAPQLGSYFVFPGWARHGVLPSSDRGSRRTLLVNWWTEQPCRMPDEPTYIPGERQT